MENLENWSILRKFDENTCYNVVKNTATNETYLIDYELDGKDCSLLLNEDVVRLCQNSNKGVAIENWKINGTPVVVTAEKLSGISESEYKTRNTEYWAKNTDKLKDWYRWLNVSRRFEDCGLESVFTAAEIFSS